MTAEMAEMLMIDQRWRQRVSSHSSKSQAMCKAEKELNVLLQHFEFLFAALGGHASAVLGDWSLCRMVAGPGDPILRALPLTELYSRAFVFISSPCTSFNVLLVAAYVGMWDA